MSRRDPAELLPLTPAVFHILLSLADAEKHGYAIMMEVNERTGGQIRMGAGTLYGSIKRLLAQGLIVECPSPPGIDDLDERRRYYRLTELGRKTAAAEASRLENLVDVARSKRLLAGGEA